MSRVLVPALGLALLIGANAAAAQDPCALGHAAARDGAQVLTLQEAAALLRLNRDALAEAAERGDVPGRKLTDSWRFSRAALIAWLAGSDRPAECFEPELAAAVAAGPAGERGPALAQADVPPQEEGAEAERFGEAPETEEARDVALREQAILLRAGQLILEPSISYARTDAGFRNPLGGFETKSEALSAGLTARYGIGGDLQLSVGLPFAYETREEIATGAGGGAVSVDSSDAGFGDFSFGASYRLLAEDVRRPAVFLSGQVLVPTDGSDAYGLGGGLSLTKDVDPATLFATASYLHTFDADERGAHDDAISADLGFAFRINDLLAYSTSLSAAFNPRSEVGGFALPSDENYFLDLALTWLLAENLYLEPSVSYLLNGPEDSVSFGLRMPYIFDLGG